MMEKKEDFEYKLQDTIDQLNTIAYHGVEPYAKKKRSTS